MLDYLLLVAVLFRTGLRRHGELVAENLLLRHQLAVLTRPTRKRPRLHAGDRLIWVVARGSGAAGTGTWPSCGRRRSSVGTGEAGGSSGAGSPVRDSGARG